MKPKSKEPGPLRAAAVRRALVVLRGRRVTLPLLTVLCLALVACESRQTRDVPPPLDELSRRAVQYFVDQSHPETGFTRDRARNRDGEETRPVASIAATGFALAAYAVAAERDWLEQQDAVERTRRTLRALEKAPVRERGWFYHFFDWETGERVWSCEVSSIDTAIFLAGLLLAERGLRDEEVTARTQRLVDAVDWRWMLTDGGERPEAETFSHGWRPERGFIEHRWSRYSEHLILYILALGLRENMPQAIWEGWERPIVEYEGWRFLTGGPLFLHQMSHVFLDLEEKRDRLEYDYFVSSRNATLANRRYCELNPADHPRYSAELWGLSACDGPDGYVAFGAPGVTRDDGTLAPAAAVASVLFTPGESIDAARSFADQIPDGMGRYGFPSGWNPGRSWQAPDVIGIDLGQLLLAIENHRDGLPHRLLSSHKAVRRGMSRAGFRRTEEGPIETRPLRRQAAARHLCPPGASWR